MLNAGDEITFLPGFEVKVGAEFHAYIENSQYITCVDALLRVANYDQVTYSNNETTNNANNLQSLEEKSNAIESISIFPNPTNNKVHIAIDFCKQNYIVTITNNLGVQTDVFSSADLCNNGNEINLANYANGIYFVKINSEQINEVRKVVVE